MTGWESDKWAFLDAFDRDWLLALAVGRFMSDRRSDARRAYALTLNASLAPARLGPEAPVHRLPTLGALEKLRKVSSRSGSHCEKSK